MAAMIKDPMIGSGSESTGAGRPRLSGPIRDRSRQSQADSGRQDLKGRWPLGSIDSSLYYSVFGLENSLVDPLARGWLW